MTSGEMSLCLAYEIVGPFVYIRDEPPGPLTDNVKMAAKFIIENQGSLPDFQSEKFCIAVCCDLEFEIQRECAWFVVSDMLNGSFSWITHLSNYSVEKALHQAGIISAGYCTQAELRRNRIKFHSSEIPRRIIEKYNLPTHRLHSNRILTEDEKKERAWFNVLYSTCYATPLAL